MRYPTLNNRRGGVSVLNTECAPSVCKRMELPARFFNQVHKLLKSWVCVPRVCCYHWKQFYQTWVPVVLGRGVGMQSYLKVTRNPSSRSRWRLSAVSAALMRTVAARRRDGRRSGGIRKQEQKAGLSRVGSRTFHCQLWTRSLCYDETQRFLNDGDC